MEWNCHSVIHDIWTENKAHHDALNKTKKKFKSIQKHAQGARQIHRPQL